jgi:hypothetical protein
MPNIIRFTCQNNSCPQANNTFDFEDRWPLANIQDVINTAIAQSNANLKAQLILAQQNGETKAKMPLPNRDGLTKTGVRVSYFRSSNCTVETYDISRYLTKLNWLIRMSGINSDSSGSVSFQEFSLDVPCPYCNQNYNTQYGDSLSLGGDFVYSYDNYITESGENYVSEDGDNFLI